MDIKITSIASFGFNSNALSVHGVLNNKHFEVLVQLPDTTESKHELVKGDISEAELNMIVNEAEDMLSPLEIAAFNFLGGSAHHQVNIQGSSREYTILFDNFNYKNIVLIKDEGLSSYFNKTIYSPVDMYELAMSHESDHELIESALSIQDLER